MLKISKLKSSLLQHKLFFIFLLKFMLFYVFFGFLYKLFLNQFNTSLNEVDSITEFVAMNTNELLLLFKQNSSISQNEIEPSIKMMYNGRYVARIIEGCNAVSVIILFAAFIFAFSSKFLKTFIYIVFGSVIIYVLNIIRIALLTSLLFYYPQHQEILHGTIFPLFIYGIVFLLWIFWVVKLSGYEKNSKK